jgi:hypothetical protein
LLIEENEKLSVAAQSVVDPSLIACSSRPRDIFASPFGLTGSARRSAHWGWMPAAE